MLCCVVFADAVDLQGLEASVEELTKALDEAPKAQKARVKFGPTLKAIVLHTFIYSYCIYHWTLLNIIELSIELNYGWSYITDISLLVKSKWGFLIKDFEYMGIQGKKT